MPADPPHTPTNPQLRRWSWLVLFVLECGCTLVTLYAPLDVALFAALPCIALPFIAWGFARRTKRAVFHVVWLPPICAAVFWVWSFIHFSCPGPREREASIVLAHPRWASARVLQSMRWSAHIEHRCGLRTTTRLELQSRQSKVWTPVQNHPELACDEADDDLFFVPTPPELTDEGAWLRVVCAAGPSEARRLFLDDDAGRTTRGMTGWRPQQSGRGCELLCGPHQHATSPDFCECDLGYSAGPDADGRAFHPIECTPWDGPAQGFRAALVAGDRLHTFGSWCGDGDSCTSSYLIPEHGPYTEAVAQRALPHSQQIVAASAGWMAGKEPNGIAIFRVTTPDLFEQVGVVPLSADTPSYDTSVALHDNLLAVQTGRDQTTVRFFALLFSDAFHFAEIGHIESSSRNLSFGDQNIAFGNTHICISMEDGERLIDCYAWSYTDAGFRARFVARRTEPRRHYFAIAVLGDLFAYTGEHPSIEFFTVEGDALRPWGTSQMHRSSSVRNLAMTENHLFVDGDMLPYTQQQ